MRTFDRFVLACAVGLLAGALMRPLSEWQMLVLLIPVTAASVIAINLLLPGSDD